MRIETIKQFMAMSLSVITVLGITLCNPIKVYAADIDTVAFQEAINADDSNVTAEAYTPNAGESKDVYNLKNWSITNDGESKYVTFTGNKAYSDTFGGSVYGQGIVHIVLPEDGSVRNLMFEITISTPGDECNLYEGSCDSASGTLLWTQKNDGTETFNADVMLGAKGTDFYLVTDISKFATVQIRNLKTMSIDTSVEPLSYTVGDNATAEYQNGTLTISGTGTVSDTSIIPDVIKNSVETLIIGDGILEITDEAFMDMTNITSVDFPSGLVSIGDYAFKNCTGITEVYLDCPKLELGSSVFMGCTDLSKVYINIKNGIIYDDDEREVTAYNAGFMYSQTTGEGGTNMSSFKGAGSNTEGLEIVFGEGMLVIPEGLFWEAYSIKSITIPDTVTQMGVTIHGTKATYRIFETTNQIGETAVYTNSDIAKAYSYSNDGLTANISTSSEEENGAGNNNISIESKADSMTITGTVQPVTIMDITLDLDGIAFSIDSDRNFTGKSGTIINGSSFPIDVYLMNIVGKTGNEPVIVENNKYTEKEWNNLSKNESLESMAISINGINMSCIYNNVALDENKKIKIGSLKSAYSEETLLALEPSAMYGKNFGNVDEISFMYDLIMEFRIP